LTLVTRLSVLAGAGTAGVNQWAEVSAIDDLVPLAALLFCLVGHKRSPNVVARKHDSDAVLADDAPFLLKPIAALRELGWVQTEHRRLIVRDI
jgi:hypothetical protein